MKYIRNFSEHSAYEAEMSKIPTPSVSYCRKENECHFVPFNVIMFKVGDLNGNTNQKVKVSYNEGGSDTIPIVEGNRWYVHNIPSGKSLKLFIGIRDIITDTIISAKLKRRGFTQMAFIEEASGDVKFIGCDTSNVTDMEWMFNSCLSLQTLDLSSFDTSNVTSLTRTFGFCESLQTLDLSSFDTSKVTEMTAMFMGCSSLQTLDLSSFDTSKVTRMGYMFNSCYHLQTLDLSSFDTSKVTKMGEMFGGCSSLQTLDLSSFDTSKVTEMGEMFRRCFNLRTIYMRNCNQATIDKIKAQLKTDGILDKVTIITE